MKRIWNTTKTGCILTAALVLSVVCPMYGQDAMAAQSNSSQTTMYGIGSTSKVVTAAAVMKLAEEGKIDLDTSFTVYIPEFTMSDPRYQFITPRMLLDHSSGLPGGTLTNAMLLGDPDTENHDMLLMRLKTQRLKADPGEFSTYCNDGFTLLEILVERVTGISFTEYLENEFVVPLNLTSFLTPQSANLRENLAAVYEEQTKVKLPPEFANVIGSGGIYATAEDLCTFSQIFMREPGNGSGILSERSAKQMEYSQYARDMNPDGRESNLSYGLGWDSVETYPFARYGIKALVKGGDTSYYHSSLTVLPEENISCAVLSSGGSSAFNQLAVQEILMTYLDEVGRIERENEETLMESKNMEAASMPSDLTAHSGWYAGNGLWKLSIEENGTLTLEDKAPGNVRKQTYRYHKDGRFYSEHGSYISTGGDLSKSSNGQIGQSSLEIRTGTDGTTYLMASTYETYPALGSTASYLPIAESINQGSAAPEYTADDLWEMANQKEFYLISEKYTSTMYQSHFMQMPLRLPEQAGYLLFKDNSLKPAKIEENGYARFFEQIPGQAGRDQNDYHIVQKDHKTYLESGSATYVSEDGIVPFPEADETVTFHAGRDTIWYHSGEAQKNRALTIRITGNGAWYLYSHTAKSMEVSASSWSVQEGVPFFLPKDGRIALVGEQGAQFKISYAQ